MTEPMPAPAVSGDFEALIMAHLEAIRRFALFLTRDAADADDLLQETYLRALKGWRTFRPDSDARRWLFTICRNTFLRMRQRRLPEIALDERDPGVASAVATEVRATQSEHANAFDHLDVRPAIENAIGDLREPHRTVLVLVDLEDRSYAEAGTILGVATGTVKTRVHRARRLVQGALVAHAVDAGFRQRREPESEPVSDVPHRRLRRA